jgi:hypothetical protein
MASIRADVKRKPMISPSLSAAGETAPQLDSDRVAALRRHIEAKLAAAPLETSPFPHLIIENFFPADVYADILRFNPFQRNAGTQWYDRKTSANTTSRTPYYARKQINFHANDAFDAPPDEQRFWTALKDCFLADTWFEELVAEKYREYFSIRFGDFVSEPGAFARFKKELFLQQHEPGYYIGPHTDIPTRIFTCIFSFARTTGFEEYGTELLVPKDPLARCWGNDHYFPDGFEIKKLAPYAPNNFLLFFKTRHSFHAVKAITPEVPDRRFGMQFQFYEPSGGIFTDLSVPDLMAVRNKPIPDERPFRRLRALARRTGLSGLLRR